MYISSYYETQMIVLSEELRMVYRHFFLVNSSLISSTILRIDDIINAANIKCSFL